jgi:hypothetical protein
MQAVKRTHTSQNAACAEADKCVLEYKSNNAEASQVKWLWFFVLVFKLFFCS